MSKYDKHIEFDETNPKIYKCKYCKKKQARKTYMAPHLKICKVYNKIPVSKPARKKAATNPKYKCGNCGKEYKTLKPFRKHELTCVDVKMEDKAVNPMKQERTVQPKKRKMSEAVRSDLASPNIHRKNQIDFQSKRRKVINGGPFNRVERLRGGMYNPDDDDSDLENDIYMRSQDDQYDQDDYGDDYEDDYDDYAQDEDQEFYDDYNQPYDLRPDHNDDEAGYDYDDVRDEAEDEVDDLIERGRYSDDDEDNDGLERYNRDRDGYNAVFTDTDVNHEVVDAYTETIEANNNEILYWGTNANRFDTMRYLVNTLYNIYRYDETSVILFELETNRSHIFFSYIPSNLHLMASHLQSRQRLIDDESGGSDRQMAVNLQYAQGVNIKLIPRLTGQGSYARRHGSDFGHILKWDFDLSALDIYNKDQMTMYQNRKPCLTTALNGQLRDMKASGELTATEADERIEIINSFIIHDTVRVQDLRKICDVADIEIKLQYRVDPNQTRNKLFSGGKAKGITDRAFRSKIRNVKYPVLKIALVGEHYFRNDKPIRIHQFAYKHYDEVKDQPDWQHIKRIKKEKDGRIKYSRNRNKFTSAFKVVEYINNNLKDFVIDWTDDMNVINEEIKEEASEQDKPNLVKDTYEKVFTEKNPNSISKNINSLLIFKKFDKPIVKHYGLTKMIEDVNRRDELSERLKQIEQVRYGSVSGEMASMTTIEFQNRHKLDTLLKIPNIITKLAEIRLRLKQEEQLGGCDHKLEDMEKGVKTIISKLDKNINEYGIQTTHYKYQDCGRKNTQTMGIQLQSRIFRGLLCKDYYIDVDMVNAHCVIAEHVWRTDYNLNTKYLKDYIDNRATRIREMIDMNPDKGLNRSKVKDLYLTALNGGFKLVARFMDEYVVSPRFKKYIKEVKHNHNLILTEDKEKVKSYRKLHGSFNYKLSYLNGLLTPVENEILDYAVIKFSEWNIIRNLCYTNIYDGFQFVRWQDISLQHVQQKINELNQLISQEKGINMQFKMKEIEEMVDINTLATRNEWIQMGFSSGQYEEKWDYDSAIKILEDNIDQEIRHAMINNQYHICFFDIETDTTFKRDNIESESDEYKYGEHKPYCVSYSLDNSTEATNIMGEDCVTQLLDRIPNHTLMYAHNLNYDYRFLARNPEVKVSRKRFIHFNGKMMEVEIMYKGKFIKLKDSYALITAPLRAFPKMFSLKNMRKEAYPYNLYKLSTIDGPNYKIEDALKQLSDEDKVIFKENIREMNLEDGQGGFDHRAYAAFYCNQDVNILKQGYESFREDILEFTKDHFIPLDIDRIVSASSVAERCMYGEGVFDGVYRNKGITRDFIQQTVQGGACRSWGNYKIKIEGNKIWKKETDGTETLIQEEKENIKIVDFDAVSLYPSAMARLGKCPLGIPKIAKDNQLDWSFLKTKNAAYMRIKVTEVGVHRMNPIMSIKIKDSAIFDDRLWIGRELFVSIIKLEDLIEYHKIKFTIEAALYYDSGDNSQLGESTNRWFNMRLRLKKEGNPMEKVVKLIMNGAYGKTVIKPQKYKTEVCNSKEEWYELVGTKYSYIKEAHQIKDTDKYMVKMHNSIDEDSNNNHVGSLILDMSKRIMNEVMCLAEDLGIKIFYQDTDSMHIELSKLDQLSKAYEEKYDRELIGKKMNQFHEDFSVPKNLQEKGYIPHAVKTIIVGKKAYYDKVQCNSKGDTIDHYRMKGVCDSSIQHYAHENGLSIEQIYEKLYDGEEIEFDLCARKPRFKMNSDMTINTLNIFIRKVKFTSKSIEDMILGGDVMSAMLMMVASQPEEDEDDDIEMHD